MIIVTLWLMRIIMYSKITHTRACPDYDAYVKYNWDINIIDSQTQSGLKSYTSKDPHKCIRVP